MMVDISDTSRAIISCFVFDCHLYAGQEFRCSDHVPTEIQLVHAPKCNDVHISGVSVCHLQLRVLISIEAVRVLVDICCFWFVMGF